MPTKIWLQP
ncbi:Protein of unknown function [Leuconostoc citreum]|nr:Protein of unknown function [Leuconostoc citreum LBAE C10]CDX66454.1 Protein of unknown function [Leuconostoc citreum]